MKNKEILREVIVDSWRQLNNNMETDVTNEEKDELLVYILSDPRIADMLDDGWVSVEKVKNPDNGYYWGYHKVYTRPILIKYNHIKEWWADVDDMPVWPTDICKKRPQPPSEADERSELPPTDKEV